MTQQLYNQKKAQQKASDMFRPQTIKQGTD